MYIRKIGEGFSGKGKENTDRNIERQEAGRAVERLTKIL